MTRRVHRRGADVRDANRAAILAECDGSRTVKEIADLTGIDYYFVAADVRALRRIGHAAAVNIRPWALNNGGAVYRHFDAAGLLLYVGCTANPLARTSNHASQARWFRQVVRIEIEHFDSDNEAMAAEAEAIRSERPLFNVQGAVSRGAA